MQKNNSTTNQQPIRPIVDGKSSRAVQAEVEKLREKVRRELKDKAVSHGKETKRLLEEEFFKLVNTYAPRLLDDFLELQKTWNIAQYTKDPEFYIEMSKYGVYTSDYPSITIKDIKCRNQLCIYLNKKFTSLSSTLCFFIELLETSQAGHEEGDVYGKVITSQLLQYYRYYLEISIYLFQQVRSRDQRFVDPCKLQKHNYPDFKNLDNSYKTVDTYFIILAIEKTRDLLMQILNYSYINIENIRFLFNQQEHDHD